MVDCLYRGLSCVLDSCIYDCRWIAQVRFTLYSKRIRLLILSGVHSIQRELFSASTNDTPYLLT